MVFGDWGMVLCMMVDVLNLDFLIELFGMELFYLFFMVFIGVIGMVM